MKFKKGDIVGRISYNKDIIFVINNIIKNKNNEIAILKGLFKRIEADSNVDDLALIEKNRVKDILNEFNKEIESNRNILFTNNFFRIKNNKNNYGKILHLDGDRRYSEKSKIYYESIGLNVIVKNIAEYDQPKVIIDLLDKYIPDILVVTGHDGMLKKGCNFNDIYNYRNSKYFIETVQKARFWESSKQKLAIIAGACQSFYEALINVGANFASSPDRILIDFKDPLIVAKKIAISEKSKFITINDIAIELRDGKRGINGIGSYGMKKM